MFCPKCGSKISDDARFCTECGLPLGKLAGNGDKKPGKTEGAEYAPSAKSAEALPTESNSAEPARADGESASSSAKSQQEPETAEAEGPVDQDVSPSVELESQEVPVSEVHVASAPAAEPASSGHSQMFNFFMQKRQIGSRLVPQFAIMIAAFIAAAGIAYAAFMLYKNVIEPNLQQPTQQEQVAEKPKKKTKKKEEKKEVKEEGSKQEPAKTTASYTLKTNGLIVSTPVDPEFNLGERTDVTWSYPQLESTAEGDVADKINKAILEPLQVDAERTNRASDDFQSDAEMFPDDQFPCTSRNVTVTYMDENYFCVRDERYATGWGPHGDTSVTGTIFDLHTGETVSPQDAFGITTESLASAMRSAVDPYLTDEGRKYPTDYNSLLSQSNENDFAIKGSTCLYVTSQGLVYRTQDYELGSYADGNREVLVASWDGGAQTGSLVSPEEVQDGTTVKVAKED